MKILNLSILLVKNIWDMSSFWLLETNTIMNMCICVRVYGMYLGVELLVIYLFSKVILSSLSPAVDEFSLPSLCSALYGPVSNSCQSDKTAWFYWPFSNTIECISCVYLFLLLLQSAFIDLLYNFLGFVGVLLNQNTSSYVLDTFFWFYVLQSIFSQVVAFFPPLFLDIFPRNFNNFNVFQFISFLFMIFVFISCLRNPCILYDYLYIVVLFFFPPKILKFTVHFEVCDLSGIQFLCMV